MMKKLFRWLLALSTAGTLIALLVFLVGSSHSLEQHTELSIGPNSTSPGSTIVVTGFRYPAYQRVDVFFQDRANGVVHAMTDVGGFFSVPLVIPKKYISGPAYVYVVNGVSTTRVLVNFVKPSLTYFPTARPTQARAQTPAPIVFKGKGFVANEQVYLVLTVDSKTTKLGNVVTDGQGHFTYTLATHNVPFDSKVSLTTTDSARRLTIPLAFHPSIATSPVSGYVGSAIYISGAGFGRSEAVRVLFQDRVVTTVGTNGAGSFNTSFRVPNSAQVNPYYNSIHVYGIKTRAGASSSFQVVPFINLRPDTGSPGQEVFALGSQFTPNGPVNVLMVDPNKNASDVGVSLRSVGATSSGTFRIYFRIPDNAQRRKTYSILFIDEGSGVSSVVYIGVS